ncbi:MAG TPA: DUF4440 domain-containing protein [Gammaproteobacteria bacterium]|jgi:ketosteroid isomerase-like protein|nr:DUF4440 domain-containing protein [Gammaproteobacteria bacterium]
MIKFASASAAESAFYSAFEQADLPRMMEIWARNDNVVCIHPGAPRMEGVAQVRESWMELFRDPPILKFSLLDVRVTKTEGLAIHQVREEIEIDGQYISMMLSTNVYERGVDSNWYMTSRHSSPEPDDYLMDDEEFSPEDDDDHNLAKEAVVLH